MGKKAKTSRKGKKEWRANISTAETDEYITRQALEDRSGGPLDAVPSDSLFFVDKSKDTTLVKKTKKHREKILYSDSVLQRNSLISALKAPLKAKRKRKNKDGAKPPSKKPALENLDAMTVADGDKTVMNVWEEGEDVLDDVVGQVNKRKARTKRAAVNVPAVEIDAPGCSYNPTFEDHQEALGAAVAQEMLQVYRNDLEPPKIPRLVDGIFQIDDDDRFFLEADAGDEVDEGEETVTTAEDISSLCSRAVKVKKLTRADLNRIARRKANYRVERERKEKLKLKQDVLRLPEILEDIKAREEDAEKFHLRREVAKAERRAREPPRLSKHKFKPAPMQVLLTEEVTGSLRQIKGCYTLARDRYKSLQRRGIIEPRLKHVRTMRKKKVEYVQGTKGQMARDMHAAREAERAIMKQALAVVPV